MNSQMAFFLEIVVLISRVVVMPENHNISCDYIDYHAALNRFTQEDITGMCQYLLSGIATILFKGIDMSISQMSALGDEQRCETRELRFTKGYVV